jgi:predicted phage terminase large subunit-like protein
MMESKSPWPIRPKEGAQWAFSSCEADGVLYGGTAGCGKTLLAQAETVRYYDDPLYTGIIFRRNATSIRKPGGMWDSFQHIYRMYGARTQGQSMSVLFPKGGRVQYSHLENEKDKYSHHGGQYAYIDFDELTEFTITQWAYLLTRNRPRVGCRIRPYWRAQANADARSWVRLLIDWWIPPPPAPGIPYKDRCGVIRYFILHSKGSDVDIEWVDKDYRDKDGNPPISFTFIMATIDDNPAEDKWKNEYKKNIAAQDEITKSRLGVGDWNIIETGGMFDPKWFKIVDEAPAGIRTMRYWDFAATEKTKDNNPDWTAGPKGGLYNGEFYICDIQARQDKPAKIEELLKNTAESDGYDTAISWEEEKGSAGKYISNHLHLDVFRGYECHPDPVSGEKISRAKPLAAMAQNGHVYLVKGPWNAAFLLQSGIFPQGKKDQIDASSGLLKQLTQVSRIWKDYGTKCQYSDKEIKIDFDRMYKDDAVITIYLEELKGAVYGVFALWGRRTRKLYIYNELIQRDSTIEQVVEEIRRKAIVPMSSEDRLCVSKIFVSSKLAGGGDDVKKLIRKKLGAWARENQNYDEYGGIITIRGMINASEIKILDSCIEVDKQMREWTYRDGSQTKPQEGFPMCKALCGVVGDLRVMRELIIPEPPPAYSYERQKIRENIKQGVNYAD